MQNTSLKSLLETPADDRLSSWKEIAAYLKSGVRTVQRWERLEGLPVRRHLHQKNGTVYAYKPDLDAWLRKRGPEAPEPAPPAQVPGAVIPAAEPAYAQGIDTEELDPDVVDISQDSAARRPRLGLYSLGLALAVLLLLGTYFAREVLNPQVRPYGGRIMLAVLPFVNLSVDPGQDYFSDGLTEEMITELGRLDPPHLGVIARTSAMKYKHSGEGITEIGRDLGVGYVLEGSVRRSNNQVRVSAQLIQVSDQTHLWAQSYERDVRDVLGVQQEVARAITDRIKIKLDAPGPRPEPPRPPDPEAHEQYLKGRYFCNLRSDDGLRKAVEYFGGAVKKDPNYAQAYAGLADSYTLLALYGARAQEVMPRAKAAATRSVALDDSLPEAHTSLAAVEALYDWNWADSEREFKRALDLDPNYSPAHHWYANLFLIPQKRYQEAIAEMKLAATLDPVSLIINTDLGFTYFVAAQYDRALQQYQRTLDLSPDFVPVHFRLMQYYLRQKMFDQAAAQMEETVRVDGSPAVAAEMARAYAAGGVSRLWRLRLDDVASGRLPATSYAGQAQLYAGIGDREQALAALEKALPEREPPLIYLGDEPAFDALRGEPRFEAIKRRIGLPR